MPITPSKLRQNIYQLLDQVLETGVPLEIERKGRRLRVIADPPLSKLSRLDPHPEAVTGDVDDLVDINFAAEWHP